MTLVQAKAREGRYTFGGHQNWSNRATPQFSVIKFLPKLPKTLNFGMHMSQLWQTITKKIFRLQASIFRYWLTASEPPIPIRTIHPLPLAKKIPFPYSKPQVIRLMSQIPQRHFPKARLSQQGKAQTSLHVRAIRLRATEPDIDIGESANQALSSGNTGPQRKVARWATTMKLT